MFVSSRRIDSYATWCYLTYSGYHVTLTWSHILKVAFQSKKIYDSNRLDKANTMEEIPMRYLQLQKSYSWKTILSKPAFFYLHDLWSLNRWLEVNSDDNTAKWNFKSYHLLFFCSFVTILVPEIIADIWSNVQRLEIWENLTFGDLW